MRYLIPWRTPRAAVRVVDAHSYVHVPDLSPTEVVRLDVTLQNLGVAIREASVAIELRGPNGKRVCLESRPVKEAEAAYFVGNTSTTFRCEYEPARNILSSCDWLITPDLKSLKPTLVIKSDNRVIKRMPVDFAQTKPVEFALTARRESIYWTLSTFLALCGLCERASFLRRFDGLGEGTPPPLPVS
jgi:hypothetical protein